MAIGSDSAVMEAQLTALSDAAPDNALGRLIPKVLAGHTDAFEALMEQTEEKVLRVGWRLLGDREQARDAAQEVFLRVYRSLGSFRQGEDFHAWLYRIAVNVCLDHLRRRGPFHASPDTLECVAAPVEGCDPEDAILLEQRRALLHQAMSLLTPAERSAVVLREIEGLSTASAAAALGVRPVTIRSQVASARAKLQAFCDRCRHRPEGGAR